MSKDMQQQYMKYQMIEQQLKQTHQQLQMLDQQTSEFTIALQALDDINNTKPGTEILIPVSNGIFAKAELKNNAELIVNVGANTAVTKDVNSAKELIQEQMSEMKQVHTQLLADMQQLSEQAEKIGKEINSA